MANTPALIKQSDATRLIKAAKAAGYAKPEVVVSPDGTIRLICDNDTASKPSQPNDDFWAKELGE